VKAAVELGAITTGYNLCNLGRKKGCDVSKCLEMSQQTGEFAVGAPDLSGTLPVSV